MKPSKVMRLFVAARGLSLAGDVAFHVAALAHIFNAGKSSFQVSLALGLSAATYLVTARWVGKRIDRWDSSRVMVLVDLYRAAVMGALLLDPGVIATIVCTPLLTLGAVFFMPASQKFIRQNAPGGELLRMNSMLGGVESAVKLLVPALIGAALVIWDFRIAVLLNLGSYIVSGVILSAIAVSRDGAAAGESSREAPWSPRGEGAAPAWGRRGERVAFLSVSGIFGFANGIATVSFVSMILQELGRTEQAFGSSYSLAGAGLVVGSWAAGRMKQGQSFIAILITLCLCGSAWIGYWMVPEGFGTLRFLESVFIAVFFVFFRTHVQERLPQERVGEAFVEIGAVENLSRMTGLVTAGVLADFVRPSELFGLVGGGAALAAAALGRGCLRRLVVPT